MHSKFLSSFEAEAETKSFLFVISDPIVLVWACQILSKDDKTLEKMNQNLKGCSMVIMASFFFRNIEKFKLQREA